jgi:hypothetical protein
LHPRPLELSLLPGRFAVCRLDPGSSIPDWALRGEFFSATRTVDELSVVCEEACVPAGVQHQAGWRIVRVRGPLAFSETGVLASLAMPLAETGISLFTVSTFDTDYLLVLSDNVEAAVAALERAGHRIFRGKDE